MATSNTLDKDEIVSYEGQNASRVRRVFARDRGGAMLIGYKTESGEIVCITGDEEAPYVKIINPSTDPVMVQVVAGANDHVQGVIAHDSADNELTNFPVKIGGHATDSPTTGNVAVTKDDMVDAAYDLQGRMLALVEGTQAHDAVMLSTNNPTNVGGYSSSVAPTLVSADGDVSQNYLDRAGRQQVNQETAIAGENIVLSVLRTVRGKLAVEQESWSVYDTALGARETSKTAIKTGAGRIGSVLVSNGFTDPVTCFVFDNTAASGRVIARFQVPAASAAADGTAMLNLSDLDGDYFSIGLSVAVSTSSSSVAAPGTGAFFHVRWV